MEGGGPLLQADITSLRYYAAPGDALRDVHLAVQPGEFVVITGPAASGKSTLCYCLAGVIPHSIAAEVNGAIRVAGHRLQELRLPEIAALLGLVMQAPENQLFSLSVREDVSFGPENLCLPLDDVRRRMAEALAFTGMQDYLDRPSDQLSGGEAQRVVISCILAMRPRLLILDQPTAELDPEGRWQVYQNLHRLNQTGTTIVVAEDRLADIAAYASRVLVMREGTVVRDEPMRRFFAHDDLDQFGIRVPDTIRLHHYLKVHGLNSHAVPVSVEEVTGQMVGLRRQTPPSVKPALTTPGVRPPRAPAAPAIEIRNLSFLYPNKVCALDDVSLRCDAGEFVAVIGENGAGKTTLAKHLIGLLKPPPDAVRVAGADVSTLSVAQASRHVGYLFQDPDYQIFNDSVFDEVAFGLRSRKVPKAAIESKVVGILRRLKLDHLRQEHPYTLSRGQRQRLALAATWVLDPPILVVDEPSTGLDRQEATDVMGLLKEFQAAGGTVVIITHDLELVFAYAERVLVMRKGRIQLDLPASAVQAHFEEVSAAGVRLPQFMHLVAALGLTAEINDVPALGDAILAGLRG